MNSTQRKLNYWIKYNRANQSLDLTVKTPVDPVNVLRTAGQAERWLRKGVMMEEEIKTVVCLQPRTDMSRVTLFITNERLILSKAGGWGWGAAIGGTLLAGPIGLAAAVAARHVHGMKKSDAVSRLSIDDIFDVDKKASSIYFKDIQKMEFGRWGKATTFKVKSYQKNYSWIIAGLPKSMMSEEERKKSLWKNTTLDKARDLLREALPKGSLHE